MKAKRIVSILLTGSMLLSLLPVSALAAAPVFDAPAQTTAKKAAPLVQEADASRSTEEEAATRSSRDLDAENGTADSGNHHRSERRWHARRQRRLWALGMWQRNKL